MNTKTNEIKKLESPPKVIKNLFSREEIDEFLKLYNDLPVTVHNKKQNVIKKRWLQGFNKKLEKIFFERLICRNQKIYRKMKDISNFQKIYRIFR